jgi:hypothetical protein
MPYRETMDVVSEIQVKIHNFSVLPERRTFECKNGGRYCDHWALKC